VCGLQAVAALPPGLGSSHASTADGSQLLVINNLCPQKPIATFSLPCRRCAWTTSLSLTPPSSLRTGALPTYNTGTMIAILV